jgi:phosphoribosylamine--glycine ligase
MGAVCPPSDATQELIDLTVRTILEPTARELARRGTPFVGALYAGLMLTAQGPQVLEFNCRLGDPEAQAILLRLRSDPLPLFFAATQRRLAGQKPVWDSRTAVAVVLAAHGYPGAPRAMDEVHGLEALAAEDRDDLWVLHAGTKLQSGKVVTAGGRVLTVAALGAGPGQARARAYGALARISFAGMQSRADIAAAEV